MSAKEGESFLDAICLQGISTLTNGSSGEDLFSVKVHVTLGSTEDVQG